MPKVYNKRHRDVPSNAVYVGRPTKWGNPYTHLVDGTTLARFQVATRDEAIEKYTLWIAKMPHLVEEAKRLLRGKDLVCWCAPKACHADVLLKIANED